jgi:hypothetical protein
MTHSTSLARRMLICVTKSGRPTFGNGTSFLRHMEAESVRDDKAGIGSSPLIGLGVNNSLIAGRRTDAYALIGRFAKVFAVTR